MNTTLATESRTRQCVRHADRAALYVRVEKCSKPVPQIRRIPECQECADRKPKKEDGLLSSAVFKL